MSTKDNKNKNQNTAENNTADKGAPHVNRKFAIVVIAVFITLLIVPTLVWGVLQVANHFNPSVMETLDFDTGENRAKAKLPEEFDPATFTSKLEAWYNDHLPFRSVLYNAQHKLEEKLEIPYEKTIRPFLLKLLHDDSEIETVGGEEIIDIYETTEIETTTQETETLPTFETESETEGAIICQHELSNETVIIKEPTCTEWGIIGYPCELCDFIGNKEYTQKVAHDYVSNITELPFCGTTYEEILTCSVCQDASTKTLVKKHTAGDTVAVVEPSYTEYGYSLVQCVDCKTNYKTKLSNKLYDASYFPPIFRGEKVVEGRNQWLYYKLDNSAAFYMGTNLLSDNEMYSYATTLQQLNNICKERGIKLVIAIWPNKEQVYYEYLPSTYEVQNSYKRVERFVDYVEKATDVSIIYPLNELLAAKPYWETYYKLDTHWNKAGAFIGLQALYKELGIETTALQYLPVTETNDEWRDMLGAAGLPFNEYAGGKEYDIVYKEDVKLLTQEGNRRNNGSTWHTTSTADNDLSFVMIADSFRINMNPFLEKDFAECFVTNRSNLNGESYDEIIEAVKNADILVISAVERYDSANIDVARKLIAALSE